MSVYVEFDSPEFHEAVHAAGRAAFEEALAHGQPVFYLNHDGLDVMQRPDGHVFEIRWIAGAPAGENFEIVRELTATAA
jgi:hypothetical protein